MKPEKVARTQKAYYGGLFHEHGPAVDAVASGKQIYKDLRYEKLSQVFHHDSELTLHDVGFGLGHYYEFLKTCFPHKKIYYSGSEVTPEFVAFCKERYPGCEFFERDLAEKAYDDRYDYLVFGGTFYHLVDTPKDEFAEYVKQMLSNAFKMCRRGISFNFITGFCEYFYDDLFYGNVDDVVSFVAKNLSRFFILDHGYPLYEFTMMVYKENYIEKLYPQPEFAKYF